MVTQPGADHVWRPRTSARKGDAFRKAEYHGGIEPRDQAQMGNQDGGGDPTCDMVTRNHRRIHAVHRVMHSGACL